MERAKARTSSDPSHRAQESGKVMLSEMTTDIRERT
jgi:hypothetical protein